MLTFGDGVLVVVVAKSLLWFHLFVLCCPPTFHSGFLSFINSFIHSVIVSIVNSTISFVDITGYLFVRLLFCSHNCSAKRTRKSVMFSHHLRAFLPAFTPFIQSLFIYQLRLEACPMPVVFDSSGPEREMFESFAPQVMVDKKKNFIKVTAISQLNN